MNKTNTITNLYSSVVRQAYGPVLRGAGWLIMHAGPLTPTLLRLGDQAYKRLVPSSYHTELLNPVPSDGLLYYHDGTAAFQVRLMASGLYEPNVIREIKRLVRPGMTVVDVGANIGFFTLIAARAVGESGAVWAFEPVPSAMDLLKKSAHENGFERRVHALQQAVSDTDGTVRLHINTSEHVQSSLYASASTFHFEGASDQIQAVDVTATTLDSWAEANNWPAIGLMKIDVEGAEKAVLTGMRSLSERNPQMKLIIEFHLRTMEAAGVSAEAFVEALRARGFTRFYAIGSVLRPLRLPEEIPWLVNEARSHKWVKNMDEPVNLLCEKT